MRGLTKPTLVEQTTIVGAHSTRQGLRTRACVESVHILQAFSNDRRNGGEKDMGGSARVCKSG